MPDARGEKDTALLQLQLQQGRASLQAAASLGHSLAASSTTAAAASGVDPEFAAAQDRHVFRNTAKAGYIPDGPRPGAVSVPVQQATVTPVAPVPAPAPAPEQAVEPQEENEEETDWWKKYPLLAGLDKFDFYCSALVTGLLVVCIIIMATVLAIRFMSNNSNSPTDATTNHFAPSATQLPQHLTPHPTPRPTTAHPTPRPTTAAPTVSSAPSSGPSISLMPSSSPTIAPSAEPTLSNVPSSIPTGTPTRDLQNTINEITSLLPNSTLQTIENDPDSPQAKAFDFVTEDWLSNGAWPSWRIVQRFALVTLYYSFQEDEHNAARPSWLHPGTDECQWSYFNRDGSLCDKNPNGARTCKTIDLSESNLRGTIAPELALLTVLHTLDLTTNQIEGTLPTQLGQMMYLQRFSVKMTLLTGPIPSQIGSLSQLKELDASKTGLTGTLPTTLGQLTGLKAIRLYSTSIGGSIPSQIGLCASLTWLSLSIAQWESTIPSQLGLLGGLQTLFLYRNRLTGAIPSQLGNLKGLKSFDMTYNQLSGVVPEEVCAIKGPTRFDCDESLCGCGRKYSECACPAA